MTERKHRTHFDVTATDRATAVFRQVEGGLGALRGKYLAVAAAGASLFAAGTFAADAIRYRAALQDVADATGDNLRTLDGMARIARVAGVEVAQLGGLLTKFVRNLNAADDEGSAAARAIEAIGLSVEGLRAMSPADAMLEVARALDQFEGGAGKVAAATALLGREGATAIPFLKDLAEAGEIQGRATREQVEQAARLEKEWRRLGNVFRDAKDEMSGALIPVFADFAEELREAIRLTGGLFGALKLFGRDIFRGFASPAEQIRVLNDEIENLRATQGKYRARGDLGLATSLEGTIASKQAYKEYLQFLQRQDALKLAGPGSLDARDLRGRRKGQIVLDDEPGGASGAVAKSGAADHAKSLQMQQDVLDEARRLGVQFTLDQDRKNAALAQEADGWRDVIDPMRKYGREMERLDDLRRQGVLTEQEYIDAYLHVATSADRARLESERLGEASASTKNAFADMGFTAGSALEDIITKGGRASDVMNALGMDMARIILRRQVFDPMATGIEGMLGSMFPGVGKAGSSGFDEAGFANVNWFGNNATGGSYVVGGHGGTDSQLVAFRATPGEHVEITPQGQRQGGVQIHNNVTVHGSGLPPEQLEAAVSAAIDRSNARALRSLRYGGKWARAARME